ncbi:MAG TPA: prolipoprotein diacylglyceryl transferase [Longimicrobiales bacterium]|nr:prolipoprotein diacylglyceryl transferase [Longimicrobiales bacterium]
MFPVIFRIGSFAITSFGLMMFFSFITGSWIMSKQLKRYNMDPEIAWDILAVTALSGILGAKIYYLLLHWQDLVNHPFQELTSRGGLVWYGGFIGGVTAFYFQCRARKLPIAKMYDTAGPTLALGYAVGRLGCFLVGDDYGVYTNSWVGVAFPKGSPPSTAGQLRLLGDTGVPTNLPDSAVITVHPTQLYEVGLALVMFAILWHLGGKKLKPGQLFIGFTFLYSIERFAIEFVRAKGDRVAFGLSTSQIVSIILFIGSVIMWFRQERAASTEPRASTSRTRA